MSNSEADSRKRGGADAVELGVLEFEESRRHCRLLASVGNKFTDIVPVHLGEHDWSRERREVMVGFGDGV